MASVAGLLAGSSCSIPVRAQRGPEGVPPAAMPPLGLPGLRDAAGAAGIRYGCAVQAGPLAPPSAGLLASAVQVECSILVPEGALKWAALRPSADRFDFWGADAILAFAQAHGQSVRGHALLWHQALPLWFTSAATSATAAGLLARHVEAVCGRYAGRLQGWDVVNEVVDADVPDGLRDTVWRRLLGPGYVAQAFGLARDADPSAVLCLNEYGLEADGLATDAKRRAVLLVLSRLLDAGAPVQSLGLQAHLTAGDRYDTLPGFLAKVSALGLRVGVTELDVSDERLPGVPLDRRDAAVATCYASFLQSALLQPGLVGEVLTWGLSDVNSWLQTHWPRSDGLAKRPLPLDGGLARKPAWAAIRGAFLALPPV